MNTAPRGCQVASTLDAAESILRATAKRLMLPVEVIRKERACGVIPKAPVIYETLEELALAVQAREQGGGRAAARSATPRSRARLARARHAQR